MERIRCLIPHSSAASSRTRYGENSLQDTIIAMKKVQGKLQADETELDKMLASVIGKLQQISEQEFERIGMQ